MGSPFVKHYDYKILRYDRPLNHSLISSRLCKSAKTTKDSRSTARYLIAACYQMYHGTIAILVPIRAILRKGI